MPCIELNKIAAMMAMKLFAFNLLACMKKDMVAEFGNLTAESVFEEIIEFPAVVKAEADRIVVTFYGNYTNEGCNIKFLVEISGSVLGRFIPLP